MAATADGALGAFHSLTRTDPVAETSGCSGDVLVLIDDRGRVESVSHLPRRSPDARL
jgi:hypothetical protein